MSFLNAEWRKLALANYIVEPALLLPYLPYGTELDLWNGKCYVSLVGFMFKETRILGVKIPKHVNFEEVNLRFYVKREHENQVKRGVVFIKEIVPKPALTFVANTFYKEHYETLPMRHKWTEENESLVVSYEWKVKNVWNSFLVQADNNMQEILPQSEAEFICEHYWGYAKVNAKKTNEYEVTHPLWKHYNIMNYKIEVDFGCTYGTQFSFLNELKPSSVMLAEGSEITVESKTIIRVK